jgi:hypothetical protein
MNNFKKKLLKNGTGSLEGEIRFLLKNTIYSKFHEKLNILGRNFVSIFPKVHSNTCYKAQKFPLIHSNSLPSETLRTSPVSAQPQLRKDLIFRRFGKKKSWNQHPKFR